MPTSGSVTAPPPGGGTRRASPGASGWTLAPSSYGNSPGAGYEGINLDIRCREAGRTHEDCPEYLRTFQGRDRDGFEDYERYRPLGVEGGPNRPVTGQGNGLGGLNIAGGSDPWSAAIGDNSVNAGGPSTTLLDDGPEVDFSREFLGNPIRIQDDPGRLRDLLTEPDQDEDLFVIDELILPEPDQDDE